ncbi:MAG TPA: 2Fe-2S iron-sulfur cluster binding domain-containing protein [Anaerolineae bacterium]|nr:2Fe-2S iron-sulfur cluster binding domain-containing protein [Anaerolineae bacterium]
MAEEITLVIDGKEVKGERGDTILQVCQKNGIDVPTLCHFAELSNIGSCRICIVEIEERGRTRMDTACTTPAAEGMAVRTNGDKLNALRKATIELLFAERNHFCMYCEMSGDCELQSLAYRFGMDHIRYPHFYPKLPVDSSRKYFILDHNRCVLCRRCVRACAELVGNHTIGVMERGIGTMIHADLNVPFGESSCVSCGTCLSVCPTGALVDRRSAYMGREAQVERVKSTCLFCSVGCGTELVVRDNYLLRVEGDWDAEPNKGLLCAAGRFEPLYDETRERATRPLVRRNGRLEEASWEEALDTVAGKLRGFDKEAIGALASTRATNETLQLFAELFRGMGVKNVGCLEGPIAEPPEEELNLADLDEADMFIVVGEDLAEDHQVAGFFVKRGVNNRGARLVVVDEKETGFVPLAHRWLKPGEVEEAVRLCNASAQPAVIYGARAGEELEVLRRELAGKARFFWMAPGTNARGALAAGLGKPFDAEAAQCVYVLACDQGRVCQELLAQLKKANFVAVQSSYVEPWNEVADVILPTVLWAEKEGSITNLEGRTLKVNKAVEPPAGVRSEGEIVQAIAGKIRR